MKASRSDHNTLRLRYEKVYQSQSLGAVAEMLGIYRQRIYHICYKHEFLNPVLMNGTLVLTPQQVSVMPMTVVYVKTKRTRLRFDFA